MNTTLTIAILVIGAIFTGLITALLVRKEGYSFKRYFVTGFLMGAGIIGIILKIIRDYL